MNRNIGALKELNDRVPRYLRRIDFELTMKDRIPEGIPVWILKELKNAKNELISPKNSLNEKYDICTSLDYVFWDIDALLEGTDLRYDDFLNKFSEYGQMLSFAIKNKNKIPGGIPEVILSRLYGYREILLGNLCSFRQKCKVCTYLENELFDKIDYLLEVANLDYYEPVQKKVRK